MKIKKGDAEVITRGILKQEFKKEFKKFEIKIDKRFEEVDQKFERMKQWCLNTFLTKQEFANWVEEDKLKNDEILTRLDIIVAEMRDARNDRLLQAGQFVDMSDQVADHENRICVLEGKPRKF